MEELLAPNFVEVGASGRRWDRAAILGMLAEEANDPDTGVIEIVDMDARQLTPGVVQVFWDSRCDGRKARRTSLWQKLDGSWQLVYHQGTPLG